jgi:hypothetical protein
MIYSSASRTLSLVSAAGATHPTYHEQYCSDHQAELYRELKCLTRGIPDRFPEPFAGFPDWVIA